MDNVNWLKLKLEQNNAKLQSAKASINTNLNPAKDSASLVQKTQSNIIANIQRQFINPEQLRMNNLASIDRAVYVKDLLNLPKNMVELLVMVQNEAKAEQAENQKNPQNQTNSANESNQSQNSQNNKNPLNNDSQNQSQNSDKNNNFANQKQPANEALKGQFNKSLQQASQQIPQQGRQPNLPPPPANSQRPGMPAQNRPINPPPQNPNMRPDAPINKPNQAPGQPAQNVKPNIPAQHPNQPPMANQKPQVPVNQPALQPPSQNVRPQQPNLPPPPANPQRPGMPAENRPINPPGQNPNMRPDAPINKPDQAPGQPAQNVKPNIPAQQPNQPPMANQKPQAPINQPNQPPMANQRPQVPVNQPASPSPSQNVRPQPSLPNSTPANDTRPQPPVNQPNNGHAPNRPVQNHNPRPQAPIHPNPNHVHESHNNRVQQNMQMQQNQQAQKFVQSNNYTESNSHMPRPLPNEQVKPNPNQPPLDPNKLQKLHHPKKPPKVIQPAPQPQVEEDFEVNNFQKTQSMSPEELAAFKQKMAAQLNENVNISRVSALLQRNSKIAMNKMVSMMSMATMRGMTDISPLRDTVSIINTSFAANMQNDSVQTLKNLMLLYLPWLPLNEGVGFDLEIEQDGSDPVSDTFIKILITTVNYGNLHATVSLISANSVDIAIICSNKFPKKELLKRLQKDGSQHSMQTAIDFEEQVPQEQLETQNPKAKVNLSNVNQVNPYLLLMSHAVIRHTIELDATISIGEQPIED